MMTMLSSVRQLVLDIVASVSSMWLGTSGADDLAGANPFN